MDPGSELSAYRKRENVSSPGLPLVEDPKKDAFISDDRKPLSLSQLSEIDKRNFFSLVLLYMLQGVPVGLAFGSVPFLLKSKLSYGQIGIFTLASYPYSLKLLWSPVVDAIYDRGFGRRKSWIVPVQTLSAVVLLWLGAYIPPYMENAEQNLGTITLFFFVLVFLSATQDIAVDGWALTLMSAPALSYASTAQTVGLNCGYFLSFTVFLAFNSEEFANKYFRTTPSDIPLVSLGQYLTFWGVVYLIMTILVALFKKEGKSGEADRNGIIKVYTSMFQVLKLHNIQSLIIVHLLCKAAFQANEAATNLKLLEKGLSKEDLSLIVLIDFPFEVIFGYYAAKWSTGKAPLEPWLLGFLGRLGYAFCSMLVVAAFPSDGPSTGYLLLVMAVHVLGNFMITIQFVSINAFHTQIADPLIGGTYMTTLNTISNLGGQWPRLIVLFGIDWFTSATCDVPGISSFSCSVAEGKQKCKDFKGTCNIHRDGYFVMGTFCVCLGLVLYFGYIKRKVQQLQVLPIRAWRVEE
jgi:PAT family acetyl-CoA transporter-like MFS transporter 1